MAVRTQWDNMWSLVFTLFCLCDWSVAQISYTISEEVDKGTAVGNVAKDLNLSVQQLQSTGLQMTPGNKKRYFDINRESGILFVSERIDREELCPNLAKCSLNIEAILSNPRSLQRFEVLINDINDNAPFFLEEVITVDIFESSYVGERHPLPVAHDADVGTNSVKTYKLNPNEYFSLDIQSDGDQSVSAELVLQKALDREKEPVIDIILTAIDGGKPPKTGTLQIKVNVLDVNDNSPVFSKSLYKIKVTENANIGTTLLTISAADLDEGVNGQIVYSFTERARLNPEEIFSLNNNSGELTVKGNIDYEENQAFEIRVQARDKGTPPRSAHSKVLVEVIDVNDNAPEISVSSLMSPIKEDAEKGTAVATVAVADRDGGKNGQINCKITGSVPFKLKSNYKNYFSLLVDGPLDRENISKYDILIEATDEGSPVLSSTAVISLQVSDVNDNPPRFADSFINVYVKENIPTGTTIHKLTTFDSDSDENARSTYSLINFPKNMQISSMVTVHSDTGTIISLQSFNYEELKTFQFKVQATDSGVPPLSSNVTVNVLILDENDNNPTILAPYSEHGSVNSETIPYSAEAGYFVAKIRAVDADSGYNALLSYHLSEPKGNNLFRIGTSTGEIRTKRRMSDSDLKTHPLVVLVSDNGEPSLSATVSIDVMVVESTADVQTQFRHVPIKEDNFSDLNLYLLIAIVSVSVIFLLSLISLIAVRCHRTDGDFSRYSAPMITTHPDGSWSYSKATQQYDVCFSSDTLKSDVVVFPAPFPPVDGELISINGGDTFTRTQTLPNKDKTHLDYEESNAYEIRVRATDQGGPPRSGYSKVLVEVIDVNDNAPEISITSMVSPVQENAGIGTVVALVTVTDKDGGPNGLTSCKIQDSVPFKLKSNYKNYYSLTVDGPLDRETVSVHNLTITAADEGSPALTSTAVLNVHISDVNDNAPTFPEGNINVYVKENSKVGQIITKATAQDADVKENGTITYFLIDANPPKIPLSNILNINTETGEISALQSFNYEELKTFQFKVQATDSGVPPLSSNVTVNVLILDENDNNPTILAPYSEHGSVNSETIPYSAEAGYFVAKIRAVDADSGYNALLSYHLSEPKGNNLFRIGTSTGEIRTKRRMSDNDLKTHPLVVLVSDNGEPSLSATVSIDVMVVESTADVQTQFRHVPIKEDNFSDLNLYLLIAIVSVSVIFLLSLISLIAVRCHRTDGDFSRYSAPMITTHPDGSWSYSKATQQYDVCFSSDTLKSDVVVFPAPFPPVDGELISINGGDTFTRTQTLPNKDKEANKGTLVGNIAKNLNLNVQELEDRGLSIVSSYSKKYFDVNLGTGDIFVNDRIDREELCPNTEQCALRIQAVLTNPMVVHRIEVNVLDINDNSPEFNEHLYLLNISESVPPGERYLLPIAEDADVGSYAVKSYKLDKNEHFSLDVQSTGEHGLSAELVLDKALDREKQPVLKLVLTAVDGGKPGRSGTLQIHVLVIDANDNTPVFSKSLYKVRANENTAPGTELIKLNATDLDEGMNGKIVYSFVKRETGDIITLQSFNYEELKTFQFKVQATDSGVPPLSSNVTVNVLILDENDNNPTILAPYSEHGSVNSETIPYSAEAGYFVAKIRAVDADSGYNALLSYHLSEPKGNNLFRIGTSTGEIRTKRRMSDNDLKTHPLVVLVSDNGEPSLSATVSIDVMVVESTADVQTQFRHVPIKEDNFSDLNLYLLIAIVSVSVIFLLSLISLIAVRCHRTDGDFSRYSAPMITTHPDGSWSYSKATQQYDVCFSSDTLKSDVVVFPAPFPPVDAELISINGGDTFTRTQTLPNKDKEANKGTLVGNIAKNLNLNVQELEDRGLSIVSSYSKKYFDVNLGTGDIFVNDRIDREELCPNTEQCALRIQAVLTNPMVVHRIEVNVLDINDNSPEFNEHLYLLNISESVPPGERYLLPIAEDADVGSYAVKSYKLDKNEHFSLDVQSTGEHGLSAELVLDKALDREKQPVLKLVLTAVDGGKPGRSGTLQIHVLVIDANDNTPVFSKSLYKVRANENTAPGTELIKLNATDLDEGMNGKIVYSFVKRAPYSEHGSVNSETIPYSAEAGYFVAKIRVVDADSGYNALLSYHLSEPKGNNLFRIGTSTGEIRTKRRMSDNDLKTHPLVVLVSDNGEPSLSATVSIDVMVVESTADVQTQFRHVPIKEDNFSDLNLYLLIAIVSVSVIFLLSLISLIAVRCHRTDGDFSRYSAPMITTHPDGSWSYSKATQQYDVCFSSDTLKSDVVVFPAPFPSVDAELISINGGDTFTSTQTLPNKDKFKVQATDSGVPPLSSNVTVNVLILDENDNNPTILAPYSEHGSVNSETIPYSAEAGYFVAKIRAVDADSGYNALLSYHLSEPKGNNLFRIGTSTGEIRTKRRMSDNDLKTHPLVVLVSDNGEPSLSATVSIDVMVVESTADLQTQFRHVPIKEDNFSDLNLYLLIAIVSVSVIFLLSLISLIAVRCHRTDGDFSRYSAPMITTHPDGSWSYSKATQQYDVCFSSDTMKSDVVVFPAPFPPVDGELISINGGDTFTRTQTLPNKDKLSYSISEEVNKGTVVGNIAKDLNLNVHDLNTRDLRIVSGFSNTYFDVNLQTGNLFVADRIDREALCPYVIKCSIKIQAALSNPINVHRIEINIIDVNDNSPSFIEQTQTLNISESLSPGERFPLPVAVDPDIGSNSVKSYKLSQNEHFSLDVQSGGEHGVLAELVLQKALDREKQPVIKLVLTAVDGGKPPRSGTLQLTVNVIDVNDNTPVFSKSLYKVQIRENVSPGTFVVKLNATDLDEGVHSRIHYFFIKTGSIDPLSFFDLNSETGEITVKGSLDYEETRAYEIRVQAKDQGASPRSAHAKLLIEVIDVNDNAPEISVTSLMAPVKEDAELGTIVAFITVSDKDGGQNGVTKCSVVGRFPFKLKSNYKNDYSLVVDGSLDRENVSTYNITVIASDEGRPALSIIKVITVQVADVNDNAPRFKEPVIHVFLKENSPVGSKICTINATDPDVDNNAKVTYKLLDSFTKSIPISSVLNINSDTGDIISLQSFNYEELKTFPFKVQATDSGVPPLSSNVTVHVLILDENDNNPTILAPYSEHGSVNSETIPYSAEAGYFVAKIRAVDADSGYNALLSYHLSEPKGNNLFRIGTSTGEIRTKRRMSDNDLKTHPLVVLVSDNGEPSLSATVSIDVMVVESTADLQTQFRHVPIKEDNFSDLNLYLLIAIVSVSVIFLLSLISLIAVRCHRTDGDFSSSDTLKSDVVVFPAPFPPVDGELISINGGDTFTRTQTLPSKEKISYSVAEEADKGTVVGNLAKDLNVNVRDLQTRNLNIVSGHQTGDVSVKRELDYETQSAYEIHVQATDKGSSPRRSNGKLLIEVVDVNDNAPEIIVTSLMNPVKEDAETGSVVALVTVTDKDGGKNGQTRCKLVGSTPFKLNSNYKSYYSLVVDGPVDREAHPSYNVTIIANDDGVPSLSSSSVINVQVADVNDNAPRFLDPVINIYVKENSPVGASIFTIRAVDPDVNENARVTYSLEGDSKNIPVSSFININSETGDIVSLQSFNYEELKTFAFKVKATDSGVPPLSSNVTVNLCILDENDNNPTILAPYSEHGSVNSETIPYSAEAGYFVAKIRAVDADSGYNALLSYHLSEPKGNNLFRIGTSTGEIRTKRRMSDNDLKTHPLVALVSDSGEPSLSATVSIDVMVVESTADVQTQFRHVPIKEDNFSDLNLYLLIAIVSVSVIFLLSLISLIAVRCHRTDGDFSRYSAPMITTHPDGSWSYSKATQQYDVCFSSDTLKSDVVVFPAPFPPVDGELISINGGDTFTRTQTLPNKDKSSDSSSSCVATEDRCFVRKHIRPHYRLGFV
ncbi:hypothetical protein CRENBAI_017660 [Crenichthys baileyi]|uniref:Cadherin domain-containing protein n=1 Tax=Crenichthys baileyi TaxID=28760 RepID=A0AAV9RJ44_9TELE